MIYLISHDYGAQDKHAYYDMIEGADAVDALGNWKDSPLSCEGARVLGVAPVPKNVYDDYREKSGDEWFAAYDKIKGISDRIAMAVGEYEGF